MAHYVQENDNSTTVHFTMDGDLSVIGLAKAIIDSKLFYKEGISELAGYLNVFVIHHPDME